MIQECDLDTTKAYGFIKGILVYKIVCDFFLYELYNIQVITKQLAVEKQRELELDNLYRYTMYTVSIYIHCTCLVQNCGQNLHVHVHEILIPLSTEIKHSYITKL